MAHSDTGRQPAPSLRLRLKVWRERARLDSALAAGADAGSEPALALRSTQLTDVAGRRALANAIHNVLDAAAEPHEAWAPGGPRPPLQNEAIIAARRELETVAEQLRQRPIISAQGAALASLLVWDPASPLYSPIADASVDAWAHTVCESLDVQP